MHPSTNSAIDTDVLPLRVRVGDGEVSYFRRGAGHPTLYLHSAGDGGSWIPFHTSLSRHVDLIAPDHAGFGDTSDYPAYSSIDELVDHYLRFLEVVEVDQFDLVGTSFGGWIAAALATRVPDRVRRLVLLAPAGIHLPTEPIVDLFAMSPPELVRTLYHDPGVVADVLGTALTPREEAALDRAMSSLARLSNSRHLDDPELESALPRITAHTRVIAAEHDQVIPREHCRRYVRAIPRSELVVVPDCGHGLYGELLDPVADAVVTFLTCNP